MPTKFYFHEAATGVSGTLPATGVTAASSAPVTVFDGTNRSATATIGAGQTSKQPTTLAQTTPAETILLARFISDPIAAQTISAQTVTLSAAVAESSLNSNFQMCCVVVLWRPGTGARVASLVGPDVVELAENSSAATQQALSVTGTSTSGTAQAGDVLIFELWRGTVAQGMATAYTNTAFYDGAVEASATDCASFCQFTNDVALSGGAAASLVIPRRTDRGLIMQPRRPRP